MRYFDQLCWLGLSIEQTEELDEWLCRRVDAGMTFVEALKDHPMYWAPFPSLVR
jgi:hypothetical protein